MSKWVAESEKFLSSAPSKFSILIDMRELKALQKDSELEMQKGWKSDFHPKPGLFILLYKVLYIL
jgi:hypothetical protein